MSATAAAWGSPAHRSAVDLANIMSEEFARQLAAEDDSNETETNDTEVDIDNGAISDEGDFTDADLAAALAASLEPESAFDDEAFARSLQAELDARDAVEQHNVYSQAHRHRHAMSVDEKVRVVPQEVLALNSLGLDFARRGEDDSFGSGGDQFDFSDDLSEEDFEDPDVWLARGEHGAPPDASLQAKPHHVAVKVGGRVDRRSFNEGFVNQLKPVLVTKHDTKATSARNARQLETVLAGNAGDMRGIGISDRVYHGVTQRHYRQQGHHNRARGNRLDASTKEDVLDARTRQTLLKLLNSDVLNEVHGVVSTGKEANVYHAVAGAAAVEAVSTLTTGLAPAFSGDGNAPAAIATEGASFAIKIYKTTLNEFKNRTEYIEGERRFRHATASVRGNPRKLIKLWAEKEARNLKRLCLADIPVPVPLVLKGNILVMQFLGRNTKAFPRLHDIDWKSSEAQLEALAACYVQLAKLMRRMYHDARLVHADMSSHNILVDPRSLQRISHESKRASKEKTANATGGSAAAQETPQNVSSAFASSAEVLPDAAVNSVDSQSAGAQGRRARVSFAPDHASRSVPRLFVIDVSQSVEHDHPRALEFLRRDCASITQFFEQSKLSCDILTVRQLFDFVVDANLRTKDMDRYLSAMRRENEARAELEGPDATPEQQAQAAEEKILDAVFLNRQTFIPRTLGQVSAEDAVEEVFASRSRASSGSSGGRRSSVGSCDEDPAVEVGSLGSTGSTSRSPFHTAATLGHRLLDADR